MRGHMDNKVSNVFANKTIILGESKGKSQIYSLRAVKRVAESDDSRIPLGTLLEKEIGSNS